MTCPEDLAKNLDTLATPSSGTINMIFRTEDWALLAAAVRLAARFDYEYTDPDGDEDEPRAMDQLTGPAAKRLATTLAAYRSARERLANAAP